MTDVLEVLLELELLLEDLRQHPLKVGSPAQLSTVLAQLVNIMDTILKDTTSKDCWAHLGQIYNGGMTSTKG